MHGINTLRLKNNPDERVFAQAWEHVNKGDKLLKHILDRTHRNQGNYHPTLAERQTAATVIQWLGTPVGQAFLSGITDEINASSI